jgi:DNA mismatch repair ATPase MutS
LKLLKVLQSVEKLHQLLQYVEKLRRVLQSVEKLRHLLQSVEKLRQLLQSVEKLRQLLQNLLKLDFVEFCIGFNLKALETVWELDSTSWLFSKRLSSNTVFFSFKAICMNFNELLGR